MEEAMTSVLGSDFDLRTGLIVNQRALADRCRVGGSLVRLGWTLEYPFRPVPRMIHRLDCIL
jgi:hypothetical protein